MFASAFSHLTLFVNFSFETEVMHSLALSAYYQYCTFKAPQCLPGAAAVLLFHNTDEPAEGVKELLKGEYVGDRTAGV